MKRFWKEALAEKADGGWQITLDGKPVRTPMREPLVLPTERLAEAVAAEWAGVGETIDPRAMPLTGLANAAIDRVAADRKSFAEGLANYAEGDLACYRADGPRELIELQERDWDPLLAWARRRYDVDFRTTAGLMHVAQPKATVERLAQAVGELDAFHLAGLSPLVTIGGSLVAALGVLEGAFPPDKAWAAVSLDDKWQAEQWGADEEAQKALDARRKDFLAAAEFLRLLKD